MDIDNENLNALHQASNSAVFNREQQDKSAP